MPEYVSDSCSDCGKILPRNQLSRRTVDVVVGHTDATTATGKSTSRTYYETKHLLLCADCVEIRRLADEARRARARNIWIGVILAVVALVTLALCNGPSTPTSASPTDAASAAPSSTPPAAVAESTQAATSAPMAESSSAASTESDAGVDANAMSQSQLEVGGGPSNPVPAAPPPSPSASGMTIEQVSPDTMFPLRVAVMRALESGRTTQWRSNNGAFSGVVVVSTAQASVTQICKSYRFTVQSADARQMTTDRTACRRAGQRWYVGVDPEIAPPE